MTRDWGNETMNSWEDIYRCDIKLKFISYFKTKKSTKCIFVFFFFFCFSRIDGNFLGFFRSEKIQRRQYGTEERNDLHSNVRHSIVFKTNKYWYFRLIQQLFLEPMNATNHFVLKQIFVFFFFYLNYYYIVDNDHSVPVFRVWYSFFIILFIQSNSSNEMASIVRL